MTTAAIDAVIQHDLALVQTYYNQLPSKLATLRQRFSLPVLTLAEKILLAHLDVAHAPQSIVRGQTMLPLHVDRVAMQDATAQMAILQFMQSGRSTVAVPSTVHCDHLIRAQHGADDDNTRAQAENAEVYAFLQSAAATYGMGFWAPGSGIIHQVVIEKHAFPGGLMVGTDSHTPNAGGLGMMAIGVGGADAADVMAGLTWEVRAPKLVGIHLKGRLNGWASPKDIILKVLELMTTKGGTNKIVEYFGEGARSLSCTGKGTITNMGAELGATTSLFAYDDSIERYLRATQRDALAEAACAVAEHLRGDDAVYANPEAYFDEVITIDLDALEPYIVGPHSPDRARPLSAFAAEVNARNWPTEFSACLIGSCTNSSFEDLERCASLGRQALAHGLKPKKRLFISPGSNQVLATIRDNGQLAVFEQLGMTVLSNACGPCIGNWDRSDLVPGHTNAIITSFNRNFPKRNDGSPDTLSFIASPELVMAFALAGSTRFNPLTDSLNGHQFAPPTAPELPEAGYTLSWDGFTPPLADRTGLSVAIDPASHRLEKLAPFAPWPGHDFDALPVLIKTQGQTTTDHISPAGRHWLPLRGHLSGISHNMLSAAVDASTGQPAEAVPMLVCGAERPVSPWALQAKAYHEAGTGCVIVGDDNYGEGSSREHAAMSPRLLGVKAVVVRSFARIHETNLKKQGVLALTFSQRSDYDLVDKGDTLTLHGLAQLSPGQPVMANLTKANGEVHQLTLNHSYSVEQVAWFKAGSAMNAANTPAPVA
jgi:aconitate hydratase